MLTAQLCLGIGCTRAELRERMDAAEWHWWQRVYRRMPWGGQAEDERLRMLLSVSANAWGAKTTPADFAFDWFSPPAGSDDSLIDFAAGASALAAMFPKR